MQLNALRYEELFVFSQLHKLQHAHEIRLTFDQLISQGVLGTVVGTAGTRHAVGTICPERVHTLAMTQIIKFPRLTARGSTAHHRFILSTILIVAQQRRWLSTQRGSGGESAGGAVVWGSGLEETLEGGMDGSSPCGGSLKIGPAKTPKQRRREEEEHKHEQQRIKGHTNPRCLKDGDGTVS
jgi:hypothetical protein